MDKAPTTDRTKLEWYHQEQLRQARVFPILLTKLCQCSAIGGIMRRVLSATDRGELLDARNVPIIKGVKRPASDEFGLPERKRG